MDTNDARTVRQRMTDRQVREKVVGSQSPREQRNDWREQHNDIEYTDLLNADKDATAEPGISSLVEEYLSTVRVRRTISGQPAALSPSSNPRPQIIEPEPTPINSSEPLKPRAGGNRRREAEQELASLRRRANLLVQGKQYADALSLFQRMFMLGNNNDSALYWMGECEYQLGNLARAKELLERYMAAREGNVDRHVLSRLTLIRRSLAAQSRT